MQDIHQSVDDVRVSVKYVAARSQCCVNGPHTCFSSTYNVNCMPVVVLADGWSGS